MWSFYFLLEIDSQSLEDTRQFASNSFGPIHFVLKHFRLYTLGFKHGGHLVHLHVGHCNIASTICEVSEMLTEWKSKTITYGRTYGSPYRW